MIVCVGSYLYIKFCHAMKKVMCSWGGSVTVMYVLRQSF